MGEIATLANAAYADYVTPGDPNSGAFQPPKAQIRALFAAIDAAVPQGIDGENLVGDGVALTDAAISLSAPTIVNSPSGEFADAIGSNKQSITIVGAGAAGANLNTTIDSVQSKYQVTVASGAATAVSGAAGCFGTDNAAALIAFQQAALALNAAYPGMPILFPSTPGAVYHYSNPFWPTGIKRLVVRGPIAFRNISDDAYDGFFTIWCGGLGYMPYIGSSGAAAAAGWVINDTPYPIATVQPGATSVTLLTPANATSGNFPTGRKCILACQASYIASTSPPSMRTFEYPGEIESANSGTGAIGLSCEIVNQYLSTLPTSLMSANFTSAAQIFPLLPIFDAPQDYYDVDFIPNLNSILGENVSYVYKSGTEVNHYNCNTVVGFVASNLIKGVWKGGKISTLAAPNNGCEFSDHLNVSHVCEDVKIDSYVAINAPTAGFFSFKRCQLTGGIIRCYGRIELDDTTVNGAANLIAAQAVRAIKSRTSLAKIYETIPSDLQYVTVDGVAVTFTAATTTEPDIITITAANVQANYLIMSAVFTGATLKMFASFASIYIETGTSFVIDSLTQDGSGNMLLNGTLISNYCTGAVQHSGAAGSGFTTGDHVEAQGATFSVTASGGAVTALTPTQPYVTTRAFSAVATTVLTGGGSGLTIDMAYGMPPSSPTPPTFKAPEPTYYGDSNPGGDVIPFMSYGVAQPLAGAYYNFPNGDTDTVRGNDREVMISPTIGQGIGFTANWCSGHVESWSCEVVRGYTGSAISGNFLLTASKYGPGNETPMVVDLRVEGRRMVSELQALPASALSSHDTLTPPSGFFGGYSVNAAAGGWGGTFASPDTRAQLPIIKLRFKMKNPITITGQ